MPQTIYDAMKASQNPLAVSLFKAVATTDNLFSLLPFVTKIGEGFSYTREVSVPTPAFVADGHTTVAEGTSVQEQITVPKREMVHDVYLRNFASQNLGGDNERNQMTGAYKGAGRVLSQKVITGAFVTGFAMSDNFQNGPYIDAVTAGAFTDSSRHGPGSIKYVHSGTLVSYRAPGDRDYGTAVTVADDGTFTLTSDNPSKWITVDIDASDANANAVREITFTSSSNEFDGLAKLMSSSQVRSSTGTNGDEPTFDILEELIDLVKVQENMAFVMHSKIRRKYSALYRSLGGAEMTKLPNDVQVLSFSGVPMLTNDWIPINESKGSGSTLSSIYLASLVAEGGLWMGANGDSESLNLDPRVATVLGFREYDLGQIQGGPSASGKRINWFGGLALGSDLAAARSKEIVTA